MSEMQKKDETMTEKATEAKKAPAKKKDQKPGLFARLARWFREMRSELKKVSWPTGKATMKNVVTVILCVLVVGVVIWLFDWLIHAVIQALLNLF